MAHDQPHLHAVPRHSGVDWFLSILFWKPQLDLAIRRPRLLQKPLPEPCGSEACQLWVSTLCVMVGAPVSVL